jgi:hypothetical protein
VILESTGGAILVVTGKVVSISACLLLSHEIRNNIDIAASIKVDLIIIKKLGHLYKKSKCTTVYGSNIIAFWILTKQKEIYFFQKVISKL